MCERALRLCWCRPVLQWPSSQTWAGRVDGSGMRVYMSFRARALACVSVRVCARVRASVRVRG